MNAETIQTHFRQRFAAAPAVIVRAPGRINLIGEHTDYNGGFVLPAAIDRAIWLAAGPRDDGRIALFAPDIDGFFLSENSETIFQKEKNWANYPLGAISEARRDGLPVGGLNLAFGGDVPLGAGLSSSAALESGTAFALNELFGLGLSKMDMVRLAQRGENNFVGMKCGIMDMFASVMGREGHVVRLDCRSLAFEHFPFDGGDCSLLLLDSGVKHQLVDSQYNTRREECEAGVEILKKQGLPVASLRDVEAAFLQKHRALFPKKVFDRCRFVVEEIARVDTACAALKSGDLDTVGRLMSDCHEGLDRLYEVCVPETNFLVERARAFSFSERDAPNISISPYPNIPRPVLGARQMGGGFGGCTLNLLKTNEIDRFVEETTRAYRQAFGLELKAYPVRLTDGVGLA